LHSGAHVIGGDEMAMVPGRVNVPWREKVLSTKEPDQIAKIYLSTLCSAPPSPHHPLIIKNHPS
jgi:hypothetical protein